MVSLRVLLAAFAARCVAADDRQAAWIADQRDGTGKQGWRAALGSVDVSCQFVARIGTKALVFETADGRFAFTSNELSGAAFATTPLLEGEDLSDLDNIDLTESECDKSRPQDKKAIKESSGYGEMVTHPH